jgi:hypothetical protein
MTQESRAPQLLAGFLSFSTERPLWVFLRTIRPEDWNAFHELAVTELQQGEHVNQALREIRARLLAPEQLRRGSPS